MSDYLLRIFAKEAGVRAIACTIPQLTQEAHERHKTKAIATVALGRALAGGVLMGAILKVRQEVALKFEGDGPLGKIIIEADSNGIVRGYIAHPEVDWPPMVHGFEVSKAVGRNGLLTVVKDLRLKELYQGSVPLVSGELDEDLAYYLAQSEQIPSLVGAGTVVDDSGRVTAAGGVLIQSVPPHNPETIALLSGRLAEMPPIAELFRAGQTPETFLAELFGTIQYQTLESCPVRFRCSCSRERAEQALISLGADDLGDLLASEGKAEIDCHFCREHYLFEAADLQRLIALSQ